MSPNSLVRRLSLFQMALAAALIVLFAASTVAISARTLERQEKAFLDNTALRMVESLQQEYVEEGDVKKAAEAVLAENAPLGVRIDIVDDRGNTLAATTRGIDRNARDVRVVRLHSARGAWIVATMSTRPRQNALQALTVALLLAAVPLFIVVSVFGRWITRRALRPLARMANEAERISASGPVRPLASPTDPTEVAALAASFDRLVVRLDDMIRAERHFTQDAAHELRTPLTVLSGELEYTLSQSTLDVRHREGLQRASSQVGAMTELVDALLFLRRADNEQHGYGLEFVPVNLADLARDTLRSLLLQYPERHSDVRVDAADEVLVSGHAVLLGAALRNLMSNAFKFTDRGQAVRVTVPPAASMSRVVVEDAGAGVAALDRDNIFDTFYRGAEARASKKGFGLGLPILRRVARAHGGDVLVTQSPLGGARFELILPGWSAPA